MGHRKIWVKRPGASATLVQVNEEDLVDDVRDTVLKKYSNSLGRSFDAPDVTLRIIPRAQLPRASPGGERTLGPEEAIARTLDFYFPGGQTVNEALIIDVPQRRTPRPSPRSLSHLQYFTDEIRAGHTGDYFPPMPVIPSPHLPSGSASSFTGPHGTQTHALGMLGTGQVPSLPSPGSTRSRHHGRTRTRPPGGIDAWTELKSPDLAQSATTPTIPPPPTAPPLPTSPIDVAHRAVGTTPPVARAASPKPRVAKKHRKSGEHLLPPLTDGLLIGAVPPINVLLVEDNIINLKLLEAFMKRLKVRWQTAMNGREAVNKWRAGGFHLVLMDIQLPVMNGLEATKEIRRLERVNSIGLFSSSASSQAPSTPTGQEAKGSDKLENPTLFKSPVIIVALTASSLQSDRHEALAAGCNDFLTKPVNYVWLERKVMEWGCMQALIDFDGWRKWKDFSQSNGGGGGGGGAPAVNTTTATTTTTSNNTATAGTAISSGVTGGGGGGGPGKKDRLSKNFEAAAAGGGGKVIVAGAS